MNFAFAPTTLTTGCSPIVLVTTPPHPASNARRMLLSDSVGGAEERRNGFSNSIPVNVTEEMVGHKLGEFAPTRQFRGHGQEKKEVAGAAPAPPPAR